MREDKQQVALMEWGSRSGDLMKGQPVSVASGRSQAHSTQFIPFSVIIKRAHSVAERAFEIMNAQNRHNLYLRNRHRSTVPLLIICLRHGEEGGNNRAHVFRKSTLMSTNTCCSLKFKYPSCIFNNYRRNWRTIMQCIWNSTKEALCTFYLLWTTLLKFTEPNTYFVFEARSYEHKIGLQWGVRIFSTFKYPIKTGVWIEPRSI